MKAKKRSKAIIIVILSVIILCGAVVGIFFLTYQATVSFDVADKTGAVMKGASGYLYGVAENGVPSAEMVESVDVQTIVQKVPNGLQHPIGDLDHVAPMLENTQYNIVYLQDVYDTWYYLNDSIMEQRAAGTYDWQQLLDEDYLPKVEAMTNALKEEPYANKLIYCLYNECDNGVWFGESQKDDNPENPYGVWCDYNEIGRDNFNAAWLQTYTLVKSLDPNALIGGPGFCDYNREELEYFLAFCRDHDCLPEIMIYHELGEDTVYFFDEHIREYRALEETLGIDALPIVISEYGMMNENGYPGEMVKIITQLETAKVYGDNAYWRLADNLNDTCADDNSPNAEWWLMRWYTDMKGQTVRATNKDILSSNFKNYFKYHLDELSFRGFMGIASVSDAGDEIDVVCGGGDRISRVQLKNLDTTALYGKTVSVTVEETVYKGLYGVVSKPVVRFSYTQELTKKSLTVALGKLDPANAYRVVIREADENADRAYVNQRQPVRYEFENGTLLGAAYTYDSYCPASGGNEEGNDTVGGMENEGDGVAINITVPEDGSYQLDFVYGNSNDGEWNENGRQDPNDRADTMALLTVDGETQEIALPNTIRSEYTSCYTVVAALEKGTHTVTVAHLSGTYVLDSLLVTPADDSAAIAVLPDEDRTKDGVTSYVAVAPQNGYYDMQVVTAADTVTVDGTALPLDSGMTTLYLKRGLSYLDFSSAKTETPVLTLNEEKQGAVYTADNAVLTGSAISVLLATPNGEVPYITGIEDRGGEASFTVTAAEAGPYRVTLDYANNEESGVHDYNVDLIETYVTVTVNGIPAGNVFCRNTYSWQTRKTVTFTVSLVQGENVITLLNDGSVRFDDRPTAAPSIFGISVNPAQQ
ncbi:MAG: hypothetical protein IJ168_06535 [Eubacterium sp.]|nr:hypothetical protein [Eubacterium sp.]